MEFRLTGRTAMLAIAVVLVLAAVRFGLRSDNLETEGLNEIKRWLAAETLRTSLPDMRHAVDSSDADAVERLAHAAAEQSFEIVSVTRHGFSDRIVVRVEYLHDEGAGSARVRYLRMQYSMAAGWRVQSDTSRLAYYLAVF